MLGARRGEGFARGAKRPVAAFGKEYRNGNFVAFRTASYIIYAWIFILLFYIYNTSMERGETMGMSKYKYGDNVVHFTGVCGKITALHLVDKHTTYDFSYLAGDNPSCRVVEECEIVKSKDSSFGFNGNDTDKTKTTN